MIPSMSLESGGRRRRLLDDPLAIRALAHPLRLDLLTLIGRSPEMTTADAARALGISHGLASHHMRQLAKYGFVEQIDGRDNRERPWRATASDLSWRSDDPDLDGADAILEQVFAERALRRFIDWQGRRAAWPEAWREHTGLGQSTVYLTLPELAELTAAIDAAINRYIEERPIDDVAARPPGSVPIDLTLFIVALSDPNPEDRPEDGPEDKRENQRQERRADHREGA
jgi:DNA-binding transcriptional ArsR family regulator